MWMVDDTPLRASCAILAWTVCARWPPQSVAPWLRALIRRTHPRVSLLGCVRQSDVGSDDGTRNVPYGVLCVGLCATGCSHAPLLRPALLVQHAAALSGLSLGHLCVCRLLFAACGAACSAALSMSAKPIRLSICLFVYHGTRACIWFFLYIFFMCLCLYFR